MSFLVLGENQNRVRERPSSILTRYQLLDCTNLPVMQLIKLHFPSGPGILYAPSLFVAIARNSPLVALLEKQP
ncbi:hypothetical protein [Cutibacterium acnes]|uniref:hypothetical protein n=1 Tax=Cutibacterium acnes TaxID=1747 RepID=UPI000203FB00|nr:hypothetical protein [Cutibacterium acnes]EGE72459.1 hypothetical protein HMPREF9344_02040 [Cutibacterium acnes HL097PA1]REB14079.1 hypothetical protein COH13_01540 [Cutibacterium acnes]REB18648.1 hypothetical protein COH12_02825 [Cutibacterium acnes]TLG14192.1 hypothetical protein FD522_05515 [Cutibacterium acnes]TLG17129.1 hypothetical protein FD521_07705 [Cutibacterium acnes]